MPIFLKKDPKEFLITLVLLLLFWFTLFTLPANSFSGLGLKNIIEHFILGLFFAILVAFISPYPILTRKQIDIYVRPGAILRFILYISRLALDIILAGIDVARRVMRPKIIISPGIVEFDTPLSEDIQIALNANSITLTPGTITIDVKKTSNGSRFLVHCISQDAVENTLKDKGFVQRIQNCFYLEGK